jgi:hypothetical protein
MKAVIKTLATNITVYFRRYFVVAQLQIKGLLPHLKVYAQGALTQKIELFTKLKIILFAIVVISAKGHYFSHSGNNL